MLIFAQAHIKLGKPIKENIKLTPKFKIGTHTIDGTPVSFNKIFPVGTMMSSQAYANVGEEEEVKVGDNITVTLGDGYPTGTTNISNLAGQNNVIEISI